MKKAIVSILLMAAISGCETTNLMNEAGYERKRNMEAAELAYSYIEYPQTIISGLAWSKEDKLYVLRSNVNACIHNSRVINIQAREIKQKNPRAIAFPVDEGICTPDGSEKYLK